MNKYIIVYKIPVATMEEWRKNTPPEEMKAQGEKLGADMNAWMTAHEGSFAEKGWPLGKTKEVTQSGVRDIKNDMNYLQIVEAESHEAAAEMMKGNPHVQIPNSSIEVMEVPHMGL